MNHTEVESAARNLEHSAEGGNTDNMARELHSMSKEDRIAVAKQIRDDQQKANSTLPIVEFYESGDLKAADNNNNLQKEHTVYDQSSGAKKSSHVEKWDGPVEDSTYDLQTGNRVSKTLNRGDGSSVTDEYYASNGYFKAEHVHNKDQSSSDYYDRGAEKYLSSKSEDPNGKITETRGADGGSRKFHYDENGKLDQIDGHLGHWDRSVDAQGNEKWTNKDFGAVWKGSFEVDSDGDLHFHAQKGQSWNFTRDGEDVKE